MGPGPGIAPTKYATASKLVTHKYIAPQGSSEGLSGRGKQEELGAGSSVRPVQGQYLCREEVVHALHASGIASWVALQQPGAQLRVNS